MTACYVPSWEDHDPSVPRSYSFGRDEARALLSRALQKRLPDEIARRRALIGPHADKIEFFIDGSNAGVFGSQGQQRSVVLAFKLAEASLIQDILGQKPVLLLDDVMSELDASRQDYLLNKIQGWQVFITCCDPNSISGLSQGRTFYVENGEIRE